MPFHKLTLKQDVPKDTEPLDEMQSLVPPPSDPMDMEAKAKHETEEDEGQTDMEMRLQKEAEKFEMHDGT